MTEANLGVSVLVPFFARYSSFRELAMLKRALESAIDQDYPGPMEILIIDDGCPTPVEKFAAALGSFAYPIVWVRHEENLGLAAALNSGLSRASYPFIARLDADDFWRPNKIALQMSQFIADPDLTLSATGMTRVDEHGNEIDVHVRPGTWEGILDFFVTGGCPFPHGSVVARKDVYDLLGQYSCDAQVSHCEDYALWGTWIRFFKPAMVGQSLYTYTVSANSMSSVHVEQQQRAATIVQTNFRDCGVDGSLPGYMRQLADVLGCSLFAAGVTAYLMWKNPQLIVGLPSAAVHALRQILPDRRVVGVSDSARGWHEILRQAVGYKIGNDNKPLHPFRAVIA